MPAAECDQLGIEVEFDHLGGIEKTAMIRVRAGISYVADTVGDTGS
jgi:hypothetical protein